MTRVSLRAALSGVFIVSILLGEVCAQDPTLQARIGLTTPTGDTVLGQQPAGILASSPTMAPIFATNAAIGAMGIAAEQEEIPVPEGAQTVLPPDVVPAPAGPIDGGNPNIYSDMWSFCNTCCQSGIVVGAEGTFLTPISEPDQTVQFTNLVNGAVLTETVEPSFGAGIRTWIGMEKCGWGFRVRYWRFGNDHLNVDPVVPIKGEPTFLESFYLRGDTIDIELAQSLCLCNCKINYSFGGRYASLDRNGTVVGYGTVGDVNLMGLAVGANEIEGSGFVFSLGGRKPIGCCGCWNLFWNYRGSLLWADSTASVFTEANAVTKPPIGAFAANSQDKAFASKDHSENVYISEVQLGIQYEKCLCCIPAVFFARAAFEYQHWETGDVTASSNSYAFLQGAPPAFGGRVDAAANAHDGDLDLIGFTIGAGLTY